MGQKDLSEKILADYNDVFADIVNVLIFGGQQVVSPEDLYSTSVHSQYKADTGKLHELERDISKYWSKYGVNISLYGMENQTVVDKDMPFRIIGYDGAAYRTQLLKEQKPVPVVTIVLYFGTNKRWNKPCSIKELMQIPPGLDNFVNDYKIHVFDIAWLTDEQLEQFQSDFGIVANYFVQKRRNKDYIPKDERTIKHVDEVLKLLSVMSGDTRYTDVLAFPQKEVMSMCDVAERLERKGIEKGIEKAVYSLVAKRKISVSDAMEELSLTKEELMKKMKEAGYNV